MMTITHSSLGRPKQMQAASEQRHCLNLDEGAGWQRRHFDGGTRWRLSANVAGVDLVHASEVGEVDEEDGGLDQTVEPAARRLQDRAEVGEDLFGLLLNRGAGKVGGAGPERELTGDEDETAGLDRLGIRSTLERCGGSFGSNDGLFRHER